MLLSQVAYMYKHMHGFISQEQFNTAAFLSKNLCV